MIKINCYWVVNGTKSDPYPYKRTVENFEELEKEREELEKKHNCYIEQNFTKKKIRVSSIDFMYIN